MVQGSLPFRRERNVDDCDAFQRRPEFQDAVLTMKAFVTKTRKIALGSTVVLIVAGIIVGRFRKSGNVRRSFEERQARRSEEAWREEGADDIPVLAADRVSARLHDSFEKECQAAVEALKAVAPSDARRAELDEEFAFARSLALEIAGDSSAIAGSPSGGRVADRQVVEQAMEPFLRNWLEAVDHLEDWEAIRSVRGTFRGESFTATSGVVVLGAPDWIRRNAESADIRLENGGVCHRLLRLAPERVECADQDLVVGFDILDPWVMDSSSHPGVGEFVLRDGVLCERSVNLSH